MEKLYNQANQSVNDMQIIADNIFDYNSGLCKRKVPLDTIQYDVACLARELTILYTEIGRKIKDDS